MGRAATHPYFDATSVGGGPPVRFLAFWCYLPRPPPTNDSAALPPVAAKGAGACLGVFGVLLPLFLASFWLAGCATRRGMAPSGWGTCVLGASVGGSAVTRGGAAPRRRRRPRNMGWGWQRACAARTPPRTSKPRARGGIRRYGFWLFVAASRVRHSPTPRRHCSRRR